MQIIFHCCTLYIYNCRCKRERGSSTPLTAASFCARGALRGAWYAHSTQPAPSSTHRYAPGPARSTRPRCTSPPLRRARPGVHPGLQHPPGLCRGVRRHAAASPRGRGLLRPSTRGTDGWREALKTRRREAAAEEATTAASGATNANGWNAKQDFL